jgi:phosphonate transport system substrate-binding protein
LTVLAFAAAVSLLGLEGCARSALAHSRPSQIRLAVFPPDDAQQATTLYDPMVKHLEKDLGLPVKLVFASDYSGVIEAMHTGKAEIGAFGPLSYVIARKEAGAEAFAAGVGKTGNGIYHALIMVRSDSPYHSLKDLKGKKIALVDPASTSGSLMPHYMTRQETGVDLEDWFGQVTYAGTHPSALKALAVGSVDAAGVEEKLAERMEDAGMIPKNSVREILRSADLPPSPWAYRKNLDPALREKIKASFLAMPPRTAEHSKYGSVDHYRTVSEDEYTLVQQLLDESKLKRDEILKKH